MLRLSFFIAFYCIARLSAPAWAAACCGATSVAPALISGDDAAQLTVSFAYARDVGDASNEGAPIWRSDQDHEQLLTTKIEGAILLADRWQVGLGIPVISRARTIANLSDNATAIGDVTLSGAYEIIPEWDYSAWRPHVYLFSQINFPTGKSIYEAQNIFDMDAMGKGFASAALGGLALKYWGAWDANLLFEIHRSFARTFSTSQGDLAANPGWGGSASLGFGFNLEAFRLGVSLNPIYDGPVETTFGGSKSISSYQMVWNAGVVLSYLPSLDWSLSVNYSDQTLIGHSVNVALNRSASVMIQKRWGR